MYISQAAEPTKLHVKYKHTHTFEYRIKHLEDCLRNITSSLYMGKGNTETEDSFQLSSKQGQNTHYKPGNSTHHTKPKHFISVLRN